MRVGRPVTEARLRWTVAILSVAIGARLLYFPFRTYASIPDSLFAPPWYLAWLPGAPSTAIIVALQIAGVGAAVCSAYGRRPRLSFTLMWVTYLILGGLAASRGKIHHPDTMPLLASVPLLLGPFDTCTAGARRGDRYRLPHTAGLVVIGLVYFFTGYQKLAVSGLSWITSDNLRWVLYWTSGRPKSHAPGVARAIAESPLICHVMAATTVVVEFGAPVFLLVKRTQMPFAFAVAGLHLSITLLFGLDYLPWVFTVWAFAIDWPRVATRTRLAFA